MKINKSQKGQEALEFALIGGLVAIVAFGSFIFLGDKLSGFFSNNAATNSASNSTSLVSETEYSNFENNDLVTHAENPTPPEEGLHENPQMECSSNGCKIDFGDFVLDGVPANFNDYIESTGNSGGTDLLADLLSQIANNSDLSQDDKDLINDLANLGHSLADSEKQIEALSQEYLNGSQADGSAFQESISEYMDQISMVGSTSTLKNFDNSFQNVVTSLENSSDPQAASILEAINILAGEISNMAGDMHTQSMNSLHYDDYSLYANALLNPDTSKRTDIDSALICANGSGHDNGNQCSN